MIKTIIIEDEPGLRDLTRGLLEDNFPDMQVVGEADSVEGGIDLIQRETPQLVLMDIEIKGGTGFQILQKVKPFTFKLVIITAFNQYAIKAIKFSAIDYILKPINEFEFVSAIENAMQVLEQSDLEKQMNNFMDVFEKKSQSKRIILRTLKALHFVEISDIEYCRSDNTYTYFHLSAGENIMVSKPIREFAEILEECNFFRPHQSFLVNLNAVSQIDKSDGGFVILKSGKEIPISTRRKQMIKDMFRDL